MSLLSYSVFPLELSPVGSIILERCRSVFAFASPIALVILARVRSCMCIEQLDITALAFTSQQDGSRALSLLSYSVLPLEFSTAGRTILERCRSVFAVAPASPQDGTCECPFFLMSTERLDVTALAFTSQQDASRALLLIGLVMFLLGLSLEYQGEAHRRSPLWTRLE